MLRLQAIRWFTVTQARPAQPVIKRFGDFSPKRSEERYKELNRLEMSGQIVRNKKSHGNQARFNSNRFRPLNPKDLAKKIIHDYEGKLVDRNGNIINVRNIKYSELEPHDEKTIDLVHAILDFSQKYRQKPYKPIILTLLKLNPSVLDDSYFATNAVIKFLDSDNGDTRRAIWVAKNADKKTAIVPMNIIMNDRILKRDIDGAWKILNDRKKWNVPCNEETYNTLFHGLAKLHTWGHVPDSLAERAISTFNSYMNSTLYGKESEIEKDSAEVVTPNTVIYDDTYKSMTKPSKFNNTNAFNNEKLESSTCTIENFNAALHLLSRNFTNGQHYMWSFFDILLPNQENKIKHQKLYPNIETFTILLFGVKKYCEREVEKIIEQNLPSNEQALRLLDIQAKLVASAQLILDKVIESATPPVPPTKEEAQENPTLLEVYRKKCRKPLIEFDLHFINVFVQCFIAPTSRTGAYGDRESVHYKYIFEGFNYLRFWSTNAEEVLGFLEHPESVVGTLDSTKSQTLFHLSAIDSIKKRTDDRTEKAITFGTKNGKVTNMFSGAESVEVISPDEIVKQPVTKELVNPMVIFPPPKSLSRKTKATFSGKTKPLVDVRRVTLKELDMLDSHKRYVTLRGKYGKFLANPNTIGPKSEDLTTFSLNTIIDGLLHNGRFKEAYMTMWYALARWGSIDISLLEIYKNIKKTGKIENNVIPNKYLLNLADKLPKGKVRDSEFPLKLNDAIMDSQMVNGFIFKIREHSPNSVSESMLVSDLILVLTNPNTNYGETSSGKATIRPYETHFTSIFSVMNNEINTYKAQNYHNIKSNPTSQATIPKRTLNDQQLDHLLRASIKVLDSLFKYLTDLLKKRKFDYYYVVRSRMVREFNVVIHKIQQCVWQVDDESKILHNIQLIRGGLRHFEVLDKDIAKAPKVPSSSSFVPSSSNKYILKSMENVKELLGAKSELNDYEKNVVAHIEEFEKKFRSKDVDVYIKADKNLLNSLEKYLRFRDGEENLELNTTSLPTKLISELNSSSISKKQTK